MTTDIKYKLNWRLIILQIIATWLFIYSFRMFSVLHHPQTIDHLKEFATDPNNKLLRLDELARHLIWQHYSGLAGLIIAFGLSLIISRRQNYWWVNSVIVFLISFPFIKFGGWSYLKYIFLKPGHLFDVNTGLEYFIDGALMLFLGILTFYLGKFVGPKSNWTTTPNPGL